MARLNLSFLNTFAVDLDGQPITRFRSANNQGLLVYLVLNSDQKHPRDVLATLFWPEETEKKARHNLRQALYHLRTILGDTGSNDEPFLSVTRHTASINRHSDYHLDVDQFLEAIDRNDLQTAADLYKGDLLPGFTCDSLEFEDWLRQERESLHHLALEAMSALTQDHLATARFEQAQAIARRQLKLEPWREPAFRHLMQAYALAGDRSSAIATYEQSQEVLWEELGVEPAAETVELYEEIKAERVGAGQGESRSVKHNLPADPTPFIGRKQELAALDTFIADPDIRLVTLVGSSGMGKTRLALACAQQQLGIRTAFMDGIFFIDLSTLTVPEQIVRALADAFEFSLQEEDVRTVQQQVVDNLSRKEMLLLFDNFEHLLPGAGLLSAINQTAPGVQILVTSQQRLQLRNEQLFPVGGLAFPEIGPTSSSSTVESAAGYPAVQLFLQAARRNQPGFELQHEADLAHLLTICGLVAGMPLALELAASWVDMLPLAEIEAQLRQGLDLLETDMRDVPPRHRSLRAAIDYSWEKLDAAERDLFARLSVFRGGFTRAAAEAIAGADLRRLVRLRNKSFLQYSQPEDRYRIHGMLRQFGAEKLAADGIIENNVRDAHGAYFCSAVQQWQAELESERWLDAVAVIDADYRNILLAWEHALANGRLEQVIPAVNGLGIYYDAKGRWLEGVELFKQGVEPAKLIAVTDESAVRLLTLLIAWQVHLSISVDWDNQGIYAALYDGLIQPHQASLDNLALSTAPSREVDAFWRLQIGSVLKGIDGKREEGLEQLHASLRLFRELGDRLGEADVLYELHFFYAYALETKDIQLAEDLLDQSLAILQSTAEPRRLNRVLLRKGTVAWVKNADWGVGESEADRYFEQAYQVARSARYRFGMWEARYWLANKESMYGKNERALTYTEEMLKLAQQANNPQREYNSLAFIGWVLLYQGDYQEALNQLSTAATFREEILRGEEPGFHEGTSVPVAQLHSGLYREIESAANSPARSWRMVWVYLVREKYEEAISLAKSLLAELSPMAHLGQTELQAVIGYANHKLDRVAEARAVLYQGTQRCVEAPSLIALMQFLPVVPVVLADSDHVQIKERALEIWAMCRTRPFVANSQLYADIVGRPMNEVAATLPDDVIEAAQARGRELDWQDTAAALLTELTELGWDQGLVRSP